MRTRAHRDFPRCDPAGSCVRSEIFAWVLPAVRRVREIRKRLRGKALSSDRDCRAPFPARPETVLLCAIFRIGTEVGAVFPYAAQPDITRRTWDGWQATARNNAASFQTYHQIEHVAHESESWFRCLPKQLQYLCFQFRPLAGNFIVQLIRQHV